MYCRNGYCIRLPCPSRSKNGLTSSIQQNKSSPSIDCNISTSILYVMLADSCLWINDRTFSPRKVHSGLPGKYFPFPQFFKTTSSSENDPVGVSWISTPALMDIFGLIHSIMRMHMTGSPVSAVRPSNVNFYCLLIFFSSELDLSQLTLIDHLHAHLLSCLCSRPLHPTNTHVKSHKLVEDLTSKDIILVRNISVPIHPNGFIQFLCISCFNHFLNIVIIHVDKIGVCSLILPVQFIFLSSFATYFVSLLFHGLPPISSSDYACFIMTVASLFPSNQFVLQLDSIYGAIG